eukprot:scaffold15035_cov119-Isochrysis_galbana.AAC.1
MNCSARLSSIRRSVSRGPWIPKSWRAWPPCCQGSGERLAGFLTRMSGSAPRWRRCGPGLRPPRSRRARPARCPGLGEAAAAGREAQEDYLGACMSVMRR